MRDWGGFLFRLICTVFSAILLVSSLMISIELTRLSSETVELEKQLTEESERKADISRRLETEYSISEIDRYARDKLKMQTPKSGQVIYIYEAIR